MQHFPRKITKFVRMRWELESMREWNRKMIRERKTGFRQALKMIWNA